MKSADEMFAKLGYKRTKNDNSEIAYEGKDVTIIRYGKERNIFSCTMYNKAYGFTSEEILACAQLIKELETSGQLS